MIVEVELPSARNDVLDAEMVDSPASGVAAVMVTVAVGVILKPSMVAETVLASAFVDDRVTVLTPELLVSAGELTVLLLPDTLTTTVAPLTTEPNASLAVTVMVLDPLPAVIEDGETATSDWLASGKPTGVSEKPLEQADSPPIFSTEMQ